MITSFFPEDQLLTKEKHCMYLDALPVSPQTRLCYNVQMTIFTFCPDFDMILT